MSTKMRHSIALPSLTIAIPNYNHGHLIGDQLSSIFSQSVQPTRVIIIDDASTDDSVETIHALIDGRNNVSLVCGERNEGVVALCNQALRMADTDCITFLAADDMLKPGYIEKSLALLSRHPEAAICSSVAMVQTPDETWTVPHRAMFPCSEPGYLSPVRVRQQLMRYDSWIMSNTATIRRMPLVAVGGFDTRLMSWADEFIFRSLALRHGACFIPEALAINRHSKSGYSASVSRSDEAMEKILLAANTLIKNDFSDLFTPELLARTNARLIYRIAAAKVENFEASVGALIETLPAFGGSALFMTFVRIAGSVLKLAYFFALRFRDIPRVVLSRLHGK